MEPFPGSPDYFISEAENLRAELASLRTIDPIKLETAAREYHDAIWGGCRYKDLPESFKESIRVRMRAAILAYLGKPEDS